MFTLVLITRIDDMNTKDAWLLVAASIPIAIAIVALLGFSDRVDPLDINPDYSTPASTLALVLSMMFVFALSRLEGPMATNGILLAFVAMFVLSEFAFFLWVNGIFTLATAKVWAVFMIVVTAVVLGIWLIWRISVEIDKRFNEPPTDHLGAA